MKTLATAVVGRASLRFGVSNTTEAAVNVGARRIAEEINRIGQRLRAAGRL